MVCRSVANEGRTRSSHGRRIADEDEIEDEEEVSEEELSTIHPNVRSRKPVQRMNHMMII